MILWKLVALRKISQRERFFGFLSPPSPEKLFGPFPEQDKLEIDKAFIYFELIKKSSNKRKFCRRQMSAAADFINEKIERKQRNGELDLLTLKWDFNLSF